jgi:predicted permease
MAVRALILSFLQDLKFGLRSMRKSPAFVVVCAVTLGIGTGASMAMFGLVDIVLRDSPPIRDTSRVTSVWAVNTQTGFDRGLISQTDFFAWRSQTRLFADLAAFSEEEKLLNGFGDPRRLSAQRVSWNFFRLLRVAPELGRAFDAQDEAAGASRTAIISQGVWRTYFGSNPSVIGQSIQLDGAPHTIVGIMPSSFWFPRRGTQVWTPLSIDPANQSLRSLRAIGLLKEGVTPLQGQQEMSSIAHSLELRFPATNQGWSARVVTIENEQKKKTGLLLSFAMGPAAILLLIACVNVTNMLLAKGCARQGEFATRVALGASRWRLVRQQLTEHVWLVIAGGGLGLGLAYLGTGYLRSVFRAANSVFAESLYLNHRILAFGTELSVTLPLFFGLIPAFQAVRKRPAEMLKMATTGGDARITVKRLPLAVVEIALAMVLLVLTSLFSRALINIEHASMPSVDATKFLTFNIQTTNEIQAADRLVEDVSATPGVNAVGRVVQFPILPSATQLQPLWIEHNATKTQSSAIVVFVDRDMFKVLRLSPLRGELPSESRFDGAIVSEAFARRFGLDLIGARIHEPEKNWFTIIAIVNDWLHDARSGESLPTVYLPLDKSSPFQVVVRSGSGRGLIPGLEDVVRRRAAQEQGVRWQTIADVTEQGLAESKRVILVTGTFALIAVALACVGIYSVMSYSIARRTREMGIRMALGASRVRLLTLVLREASLLIAVGLTTGWLLGVAAAFIVAHELIGVKPFDPISAGFSSAVIVATGILASYLPARRAANVDPLVAVRFE